MIFRISPNVVGGNIFVEASSVVSLKLRGKRNQKCTRSFKTRWRSKFRGILPLFTSVEPAEIARGESAFLSNVC